MPYQKPSYENPLLNPNTVPFNDAEEAWFWFVSAQEAKANGAKVTAGNTLFPRPCEPLDILKVLDGLYRKRRLLKDHLLVLRHYGRRHLPPDPYRIKEAKAFKVWQEAFERITPVLIGKGIVEQSAYQPTEQYLEAAE